MGFVKQFIRKILKDFVLKLKALMILNWQTQTVTLNYKKVMSTGL